MISKSQRYVVPSLRCRIGAESYLIRPSVGRSPFLLLRFAQSVGLTVARPPLSYRFALALFFFVVRVSGLCSPFPCSIVPNIWSLVSGLFFLFPVFGPWFPVSGRLFLAVGLWKYIIHKHFISPKLYELEHLKNNNLYSGDQSLNP